VTLEAWRLGADLGQLPLYAISTEGTGVHTTGNALLVFARSVEEVNWWSIYRLRGGRRCSIHRCRCSRSRSRAWSRTPRYAGFEAPPGNAVDARLNEAHVVGVLSYASEENVIREARAKELRSYWDQTRTLSLVDGKPYGSPSLDQNLVQQQRSGQTAVTVDVTVGIAKDDLDLAHAMPAPGLRVSAWRR